jgi:ubiquinone/menaquinone biosynthesis C-methylase UbiE
MIDSPDKTSLCLKNNPINNARHAAIERERIRLEYQRGARDLDSDLYDSRQPSYRLMLDDRNRKAAMMLQRQGVFPKTGDRCLEVGFGSIGWLSELIGWGVSESDLYGIELDPGRAARAREIHPKADLHIGDAVNLPWEDKTFRLVIASTLFTSVLDDNVRRLIADEIIRVLMPGGALLWYDFAYNNPRNPNVRGIGRAEIKKLFPTLKGKIRTVTLAPPLARFIAPKSLLLAAFLEAIPVLRTHLIAILVKH